VAPSACLLEEELEPTSALVSLELVVVLWVLALALALAAQ
jgi:hypothetical protein